MFANDLSSIFRGKDSDSFRKARAAAALSRERSRFPDPGAVPRRGSAARQSSPGRAHHARGGGALAGFAIVPADIALLRVPVARHPHHSPVLPIAPPLCPPAL